MTSWIVPFVQKTRDDPRSHTHQHEPKHSCLELDPTFEAKLSVLFTAIVGQQVAVGLEFTKLHLSGALKGRLMKRILSFAVVLFLVLITAGFVSGQQSSAAEHLDQLRLQMIEVQTKEEMLRSRAAQLEIELKPENIEHSLAGIGSTRPEELREYRRRQLTIERDGVLGQLKIVENHRMQLESAIANAQALAYQESALPTQQSLSLTSWIPSPRLVTIFASGLLVVLGGVALFIYVTGRRARL